MMPLAVIWMDLLIVMLGEVSQRKTNITLCCLYVDSKGTVQINIFTKQKLSQRCRKKHDYHGRKQGRDKTGDWDWQMKKKSESFSCSVMFAHGILQARILEWVAIPFSRGSSWPRDQTQVSYIAGRFFTFWATREAHKNYYMWNR